MQESTGRKAVFVQGLKDRVHKQSNMKGQMSYTKDHMGNQIKCIFSDKLEYLRKIENRHTGD